MGLGLRGTDERRHDKRRRSGRASRERRHGERRRAGMRTLLLTAAALSAPHAVKVRAVEKATRPNVSVSISGSTAPLILRDAYDDLIAEAAVLYQLDPRMIKAVIETESAFNALAVSPVGALGLMQLMPAVAAELGAEDPLD